jgi:hypothetical protein
MGSLKNLPPRAFTRLHARIIQEEDGFRVSVRVHNHLQVGGHAWGVDTATSIEMASGMIAQLAHQFSIGQSGISINIVMNSFREGTLH